MLAKETAIYIDKRSNSLFVEYFKWIINTGVIGLYTGIEREVDRGHKLPNDVNQGNFTPSAVDLSLKESEVKLHWSKLHQGIYHLSLSYYNATAHVKLTTCSPTFIGEAL